MSVLRISLVWFRLTVVNTSVHTLVTGIYLATVCALYVYIYIFVLAVQC